MPGYVVPDNLPSNLMVYAKMLKVGLAKQSVLNKMAMDGVSEEEFYKYLDPDKVQAPPPAAPPEEDEFASDDEKDVDNPLYAESTPQDAPVDPNAAPPANANGDLLAIEPSRVDMSGMNPMPIKKTLIIVNSFIAESVTFLNRFVATCEERLHLVDQRMEKMKLRMLILENNLNSIDWLRQSPDLDAPAPAPAAQQPAQGEPGAAAEGNPTGAQGEQPAEGEQAVPAQPAEDDISSDPRYALYFKMLKCRVPPPAVRNKMFADKIPDDVIDRVIAAGSP